MNTIDNIMALADEYAGRSQLTEQGETLSREALRAALTEALASTATEYQQAAPVVALGVLKELWWIRTIFAKDLKTGGVVIKDIQGKEISKWIDRVDALGGAA